VSDRSGTFVSLFKPQAELLRRPLHAVLTGSP
jgi:hypothetical protein